MKIGRLVFFEIRGNVNGNIWNTIRAEVNNLTNGSVGSQLSGQITHSMVEECYYSVFESVNMWYGNR